MHPVHPRLLGPIAIATALAAAAAPAVADIGSIRLRVVASTGAPAPGTAPGVNFSNFGLPFDGLPRIGADSTIAFAATLSDGSSGFWVDHGAGAELVSRSGDPAPGTGAGVVFSQRLSETFVFSPPLLTPGHATLQNTLAGAGVNFANNSGIWSSSGSGLRLAARAGGAAPGLAGLTFGELQLRALDSQGRAVFSTSLSGALVGFNNESIWRAAPDEAPTLLVRQADAAPGTGFGVVFASPSSPSAFPFILGNRAGDLLFQGNLEGPGANLANDEALFVRDSAGTRLLVREGDPAPGVDGFFFRAGGTAGFNAANVSLNDQGRTAIASPVSSGTESGSVLFTDAGGALAPIARWDRPAPGTNDRFGFFVEPVMNNHDDVAFRASVGSGLSPLLGLWVHTPQGLRAIVVPGQQLAGEPIGTTVVTTQGINGFNDDGFLLFTAVIGLPDGASGAALILADPEGGVAIVARTGATVTLGGVERTITQILTRRESLSDDAHAAFAAQFDDGSVAHFEAIPQLPACAADVDRSGALSVQDVFDFLALYFAADPRADFDRSGGVTVQDVFDFLAAYFAGCN